MTEHNCIQLLMVDVYRARNESDQWLVGEMDDDNEAENERIFCDDDQEAA